MLGDGQKSRLVWRAGRQNPGGGHRVESFLEALPLSWMGRQPSSVSLSLCSGLRSISLVLTWVTVLPFGYR